MDNALAQWEEKEGLAPNEEWAALQQLVYNTTRTSLCKPNRTHQDCFDPSDQELQNLIDSGDRASQRVL